MNQPTLTEAVQTDLPSPKPNRQKARKGPLLGRLALRFAALVVAVSALGSDPISLGASRPDVELPNLLQISRRIATVTDNGGNKSDINYLECIWNGNSTVVVFPCWVESPRRHKL